MPLRYHPLPVSFWTSFFSTGSEKFMQILNWFSSLYLTELSKWNFKSNHTLKIEFRVSLNTSFFYGTKSHSWLFIHCNRIIHSQDIKGRNKCPFLRNLVKNKSAFSFLAISLDLGELWYLISCSNKKTMKKENSTLYSMKLSQNRTIFHIDFRKH